MCGIGGWLGHLDVGDGIIGRVMSRLGHRGPDGTGQRHWSAGTLIHTRLSIIDLSPSGAQPIGNEDGTVWAVFNGEIYNHRDLRIRLQSRGHHFEGHSDGEVLPHLYEEEGCDFTRHLKGMFAVAICDVAKQRLLLARDPFGIKPLFYAASQEYLAFASEINALREFKSINTTPDRQAIFDYTTLGFIPAPATFFQGIRSLEPGCTVNAQQEYDTIHYSISRYHHWTVAPDLSLTMKQAVARADELLAKSVGSQLESEVPLGSLLSGGIDSTLVSHYAHRKTKGSLLTFNVRFPDASYDETWAAELAAKHIGTRHHTISIDSVPGEWENITSLLRHAGQPFADTSLFAMDAVCHAMRKHITVAISGDGGDEAFGGYNLSWQIARIARLKKYLPRWAWQLAPRLLNSPARWGWIPSHLPQRFQELASADDESALVASLYTRFASLQQFSSPPERDLLPVCRHFERQWNWELPARASCIDRLAAHVTEVNARLVLPNDFLFKVDTASMRSSLEVRVPMLDEDVFSFGLTIPHHLQVRRKSSKQVLRNLTDQYLPKDIARKKKKGFSIPMDEWVSRSFKEAVRDTLLGPSSQLPSLCPWSSYREWIQHFCNDTPCYGIPRKHLSQRAIMLLSLHLTAESVS